MSSGSSFWDVYCVVSRLVSKTAVSTYSVKSACCRSPFTARKSAKCMIDT